MTSLARATRVLHALAVDLLNVGWSVTTPARPVNQRHKERSQLRVERDGFSELLFISEKSAPGGEKLPYPSYWDNRPRLPSWQAQRQTKFLPTGNLVLVVGGAKYATAQDGRKFRFADGKRQRLEDQLGAVAHELDMRLFTHHEEQRERRIEADETERRWLRAVEAPKQRAAAEFREAEMRRRAAAWEEAERIRTFARALNASANPSDPRSAQWISWSEDLAPRVDPLTDADGWPDEPEWDRSALEPYLKSWSAEFLRRL